MLRVKSSCRFCVNYNLSIDENLSILTFQWFDFLRFEREFDFRLRQYFFVYIFFFLVFLVIIIKLTQFYIKFHFHFVFRSFFFFDQSFLFNALTYVCCLIFISFFIISIIIVRLQLLWYVSNKSSFSKLCSFAMKIIKI